jgi:hypothetical protein
MLGPELRCKVKGEAKNLAVLMGVSVRGGWAIGARDQAPAEPPRPRTITEGYQKLSMDYLRGELERVTAFLLGKARSAAEVPVGETEAA